MFAQVKLRVGCWVPIHFGCKFGGCVCHVCAFVDFFESELGTTSWNALKVDMRNLDCYHWVCVHDLMQLGCTISTFCTSYRITTQSPCGRWYHTCCLLYTNFCTSMFLLHVYNAYAMHAHPGPLRHHRIHACLNGHEFEQSRDFSCWSLLFISFS